MSVMIFPNDLDEPALVLARSLAISMNDRAIILTDSDYHRLNAERRARAKTNGRGPGDLVASASKIFGADKAARIIARWLGREDCGCAARARKMNRAWAMLKRRLERHHNQ